MYEALDGESVVAVVDGVGAEHLEGSSVVEQGVEVAAADEGDIVVGAFVHEELEGHVGGDVEVEVDIDVGGHLYLGVLHDECAVGGGGLRCVPHHEALILYGSGLGGIVVEGAAFLWGDVDVDGHLAAASVDVDIAGGEDGAADITLAEALEVVGQ